MGKYFHADFSKWSWIRDPFNIHIDNVPEGIQEDLLEVRADQKLLTKFETTPLSQFYVYLEKEHPQVCKEAIKRLIPFAQRIFVKLVSLLWLQSKQRCAIDWILKMTFVVHSPRYSQELQI